MKNKTKRNHSLYICINIVMIIISVIIGVVGCLIINDEITKIKGTNQITLLSIAAGIVSSLAVWMILENIRIILSNDD